MEDLFCTYEQALALKELGFDESCALYWAPEMDGSMHLWHHRSNYFSDADGSNNSDNAKWVTCTAPLKQQAFRFFRDKYNLYSTINVDMTMEPKFCYSIYEYDLEKYSEGWWIAVVNSDLYYTHEESESACIEKLIEIVKGK